MASAEELNGNREEVRQLVAGIDEAVAEIVRQVRDRVNQ